MQFRCNVHPICAYKLLLNTFFYRAQLLSFCFGSTLVPFHCVALNTIYVIRYQVSWGKKTQKLASKSPVVLGSLPLKLVRSSYPLRLAGHHWTPRHLHNCHATVNYKLHVPDEYQISVYDSVKLFGKVEALFHSLFSCLVSKLISIWVHMSCYLMKFNCSGLIPGPVQWDNIWLEWIKRGLISVHRKNKTEIGSLLLEDIYLQVVYIIGLFIMTLYSLYFFSLQISMTYIDYMKSAQHL